MPPSVLFILRRRMTELEVTESLLEIMTLAAFELRVALLLLDEMAGLAAAGSQGPSAGMLEALAVYGVDSIFVERESWLLQPDHSLLRPEVRLIDRSCLCALWAGYDRLVTG